MLPFCIAIAITTNNKPQSEKVLLKVNAVKNQRFEYINDIEMTNPDIGNLHARFGMRYFVTSVTPTEISEDVAITSNAFSGSSLVGTPEIAHAKFEGAKCRRKLNFAGNILFEGGPLMAPIGMPFDLVFAVNPVAIGDSWTVPTESAHLNRVMVNFKLLGFTKDEATISGETEKREDLETLKPFTFVVDRMTGRCKSSSGKFRIQVAGSDYEVSVDRTMIPPK